jgi:hypothetical protein
MSTALKCPNPSCPYLFDPSRVPAGAVLTCPRCGMRFTLGPPVPAAPVANPPQAQFDSPLPPPTGFEGIDPNAPDPDGQPMRRSLSAAGEAGSYQTGIIAFMCFVLLAGAAVAVYFKVTMQPEVVKGENGQQLRAHNLSFETPGEPWVIDDDTRAKLGPPMILGFKRTGPDAYFCVGARDFDRREPRPSELKTAVDRVLDKTFENVVRVNLPDATFLGQPATVAFSFTATMKADGSTVAGFCHAAHSKGIGYWALSWANEKDAEGQEAVFEGIRAKLKLNNSRDNWTPKELPVRTFGGHAVQYQLLDSDDLWTEPDAKTRSPAEEDSKGDLLLIAKAKLPGKDVAEEATLVTILLDGGGGDALAQGRKYVEDKMRAHIKEADPKLEPRFIERSGTPDGDPPANPVDTPTPVVRMQMTVQGASSFAKLLVISAAKIGDRTVVVFASCSWADRELFEAKLVQIAGSLREPK